MLLPIIEVGESCLV